MLNNTVSDADNGKLCIDVDECSDGTHDCNALATCHNIVASYNCTCNEGKIPKFFLIVESLDCIRQFDDKLNFNKATLVMEYYVSILTSAPKILFI